MARVMNAIAFWQTVMRGPVPQGPLVVHGHLAFDWLGHALPDDLQVDTLALEGIPWLYALPARLHCEDLILRDLSILALPEDLVVTGQLVIERCPQLKRLPATLSVKSLILRNCAQLTALPECPAITYLDISGCSGLRDWPTNGPLDLGGLVMAGCTGLRSLPPWLKSVLILDVRHCTALRDLPEDLHIYNWADIGGCALQALPKSYRNGLIRWNNVVIDEQIACHPETLRAQDVFDCPNVERRRVMLERMGYERFLADAQAEELDQDQDAGGPRRLLRVALQRDEALVCLAVRDPSTGRQYVLRVPPDMQSCHQAAAWVAGFEQPGDYQPIAET